MKKMISILLLTAALIGVGTISTTTTEASFDPPIGPLSSGNL